MKRYFRWTAAFLCILAGVWVVGTAQGPSITAPFATAPILAEENGDVAMFFRRLSGAYVTASYDFSSTFPVISGMTALSELVTDGLPALFSVPAGPPNIGRAMQMLLVGKFTSSGTIGAAYTTFDNDNSVHVAIGSAGLIFSKGAIYPVGSTPAGVISGDFNRDGVLDLAVAYLGPGTGSPGGVAILINNGDGTFKAPVNYTAGSSPISAATLDLNGDGNLDLAVADDGSSNVYVLLGNGDGTFKPAVAYPSNTFGLSVTIADLNGDGLPDIAETGLGTQSGQGAGKLSILFNQGNGTFGAGTTMPTTSNSPQYIAAADLRGTGHNDLVTADADVSTVTIYLNSGNGMFTRGSSYSVSDSPNSLVIADYNGDGKLDILNATGDLRAFGASMNSDNVDLLVGNGDGTFQGVAVTPNAGGTPFNPFMTLADFNGDGIPDAVASGSQAGSATVLLFQGTKTGAFRPPTALTTGSASPAGAAAGDFNGDGKPDLAISDLSLGSVVVLLNSSAGFQPPSTFPTGGQGASGIATADFNGDSKLDLAVANSMSGTTSILQGAGNGTFQTGNSYETGMAPNQVVATDLNGDGKPDLVVVDPGSVGGPNGAIYVLINNGAGFNSPVAYSASNSIQSVSAGDINGDGKPDLVAAVQDNQSNYHLAILLNTGNGSFGPATLIDTEFGPSSIAIADFNGDGKADLAVAHCCGATNMTYLEGNGNGTFSPEVDFNGGSSPQIVQATKFAGNGPDLAIFQSNGAMAGVLNSASSAHSLTSLSAAAGVAALAPGSLASGYGNDLATGTAGATSIPLPDNLSGTSVSILDSAGNTTAAPLVFVSPGQVNYFIPSTVATGPATVTATSGDGTKSSGHVNLTSLAPAVFTLNTSNLAAADAICVLASGAQTVENVYQISNGAIVAAPLNLRACAQTVLAIYGTGFDNISASSTIVKLGSQQVQAAYAGVQGSFVGLDQVNVVIPQSLAGSGNVPVVLSSGGQTANTVNVTIQ